METVTWVIELLVGLACLVLGMSALRTARYRLIGVVLLVAGVAAAGHALIQSAQPGEKWAWCYPDNAFFIPGEGGGWELFED